MKYIKINSRVHGTHEILLDDEDYDTYSKFSWHLLKGNTTFYAIRSVSLKITPTGENRKVLYLHREIGGLKFGDKLVIDHIDHNRLNNQKNNLRVCTSAENHRNVQVETKQTRQSTSRYKGVSWCKLMRAWKVSIKLNNQVIMLGYFDNEIDAAKTYNIAAIKYHKDFAFLNIVEE